MRDLVDFGKGEISRGVLTTGAVRIGGAIIAFALVVMLARLMGAHEYGVYSYALALVTMLALPFRKGLSTLVVRESARAERAQQWAELRGIWRWSLILVSIASALVAAVVGIAWLAFPKLVGLVDSQVMTWSLVLLLPAAWMSIAGGALAGRKRVALGQLGENILRPVLLAVMLLLLVPRVDDAPSADKVMALTAMAATLVAVFAWAMVRATSPPALRSARPYYSHLAWLRSAGPLTLLGAFQAINMHVDTVMLGLFVPAADVGVYRVVVQCVTLVIVGQQIVNMVIAPRLAELHAAGESQRLQRLVTSSAKASFMAALVPGIIFILFGGTLLGMVFGGDFERGHFALAVLCLGNIINAMMGPVGILLNMSGHEKATLRGVAFASALNVPLNILLIPLLGVLGAAMASAATLVLWNMLLWKSVKRHLGVRTTAFVS